MMPGLIQGRTTKRRMEVSEAREYLTQDEEQKLIDMDSVARTAVERVEQAGIIFVDEIDKIAGREGGHGPDISREGVQRDILPIVEGTTVNTKHGMVKTDHILFVAADLASKTVTIDVTYVNRMLADVVQNDDLSRYIL